MKLRSQARVRTKPDTQRPPRSNTFTLSTAKTYLGRLVEKAKNGETVYILRGHERFILQALPEIEPIPMRPPGYFQFDREDLKLDKRFAKASVIPALISE